MKSDVETLNPTRVKLTVEVPFAELKPSLDAAYKSLAGQVQVPGFRKGKVPPAVIDRRFGRAMVIQEAVNEALPGLYARAVEEASVRPLGQPEVDIEEFPTGSGAESGDLKFTAEVDVRPTLVLPDYSTIAVSVDDVEVTDADVDEALSRLQVRFGTLTGADRGATTGDVVSLDLRATVDGDEVDTATGVTYEIGTGTLLPGTDEALEGVEAGGSATFTTTLAGERAGQEAEVTITVGSVKVREVPDLDDDFAQLASEFDTLDELRADLRAQSEREKVFSQGVQARDKVLEALLEVVEVPVPESVVAEEVHRHLENEGRLADDTHRAEVTEETQRVLRQQFLLDAIAEAEEVSVGQDELIEYLVAQAPRYGMDANAFAQAMDSAGQVPALVGEVARRKALASVLERAKVTDASGAPVDLGADDEDAEESQDDAASAGTSAPATDEAPATEAPAKRTRAKKAEAAEPASESTSETGAVEADEAPAKPKRTRTAKPKADAEQDAPTAEVEADDAPAKPKRTRTAKPKAESEPASAPEQGDEAAGEQAPAQA